MARGFRSRLTWTIILLVAVTSVLLASISFLLLRDSLRDQARADGVAQASFNIGVLASPDQLAPGASLREFEASGLADRFETRGTEGVYVDFGDGEPYASRPELFDTLTTVDPQLLALVADGQFGYEFLEVAGESRLVVAGRRPGTGPDFYFFFDGTEVDRALGGLWRFLLAGAGTVLVLGTLAAGAVARGVLRPVRSASTAAERLAGGDLATRVPVESSDEFASWAESFNRMAASLQEKVGELEAAQERERRFVADVSHELRTPLTGLTNEAALLRGHIDSIAPEARRPAELLVEDVGRLRRLVDELLEISRLDRAPEPAEKTPTDMQRLIEAVIRDRLASAVVTGAGPSEPIACDRRALERIVGNLLDNASIHAPDAHVEVNLRTEPDGIRILVVDDGPGVSADDLLHLFDRFYKADRARQGGSGLGLAIARAHARRLGGELTARTREPRGLVFDLFIPVTEPLHDGEGAENSMSHPDPVDQEHERSHQ